MEAVCSSLICKRRVAIDTGSTATGKHVDFQKQFKFSRSYLFVFDVLHRRIIKYLCDYPPKNMNRFALKLFK